MAHDAEQEPSTASDFVNEWRAFAPTTPTHDAGASRVGQPRAVQRPETVRLYAAEWSAFADWCRVAKRMSLPNADTLTAYLLAVAPGAGRGTIGWKRAAIRAIHRQRGLPLPALDAFARAALRSAAAPKPQPIEPAQLNARASAARVWLAVHCPGDLAGLRDRALLLLVASKSTTVEGFCCMDRVWCMDPDGEA